MSLYSDATPLSEFYQRPLAFEGTGMQNLQLRLAGYDRFGRRTAWGKSKGAILSGVYGATGAIGAAALGINPAVGAKVGTALGSGINTLTNLGGQNLLKGTDGEQQANDAAVQSSAQSDFVGSLTNTVAGAVGDLSTAKLAQSSVDDMLAKKINETNPSEYNKAVEDLRLKKQAYQSNLAESGLRTLQGLAAWQTAPRSFPSSLQMRFAQFKNGGVPKSVMDTAQISPTSLVGFNPIPEPTPEAQAVAGGDMIPQPATLSLLDRIGMAEGGSYQSKNNVGPGHFGKYQFEPALIRKYAGVTPEVFLKNPRLQEEAMNRRLGDLYREAATAKSQSGSGMSLDDIALGVHFKGQSQMTKELKNPRLLYQASKQNPSTATYIFNRSYGRFKDGGSVNYAPGDDTEDFYMVDKQLAKSVGLDKPIEAIRFGEARYNERIFDQESNSLMQKVMRSNLPDEKKIRVLGEHVFSEIQTHDDFKPILKGYALGGNVQYFQKGGQPVPKQFRDASGRIYELTPNPKYPNRYINIGDSKFYYTLKDGAFVKVPKEGFSVNEPRNQQATQRSMPAPKVIDTPVNNLASEATLRARLANRASVGTQNDATASRGPYPTLSDNNPVSTSAIDATLKARLANRNTLTTPQVVPQVTAPTPPKPTESVYNDQRYKVSSVSMQNTPKSSPDSGATPLVPQSQNNPLWFFGNTTGDMDVRDAQTRLLLRSRELGIAAPKGYGIDGKWGDKTNNLYNETLRGYKNRYLAQGFSPADAEKKALVDLGVSPKIGQNASGSVGVVSIFDPSRINTIDVQKLKANQPTIGINEANPIVPASAAAQPVAAPKTNIGALEGLAGYLPDVARVGTALLMNKANQPKGFDVGSEYRAIGADLANRANQGLSAGQRSMYSTQLNQGYANGIAALRNNIGGGANQAAVVAGIGRLAQGYNQGVQSMNALDAQMRDANRLRYQGFVMNDLGIRQGLYAQQEQQKAQNRNAAGQLIGATMQSIQDKGDFQRNYGPNSLYSRYQQSQIDLTNAQIQAANDSAKALGKKLGVAQPQVPGVTAYRPLPATTMVTSDPMGPYDSPVNLDVQPISPSYLDFRLKGLTSNKPTIR